MSERVIKHSSSIITRLIDLCPLQKQRGLQFPRNGAWQTIRLHFSSEDIPVEQKLKQITKEIEQLSGGAGDRELRLDSRQSFLSLSDLIKNIRPAEKVVPQIDSSYANTMRVLGEPLSQRR